MLKVSGSARLANDPELITLGTGEKTVKKVTLPLVWNEVRGKGDTKEEKAHFITAEAWDTAAENIAKNYTKGDKLFIEGILREEKWEKDGQQRKKNVVRITSFEGVKKQPKTEVVTEV